MTTLLPASIDIGSHSTLLLIAHPVKKTGAENPYRLEPGVQKAEVVRLGDDLRHSDGISIQSMEHLREVLIRYRQTVHALGAQVCSVVMTEAMRRASNGKEVQDLVESVLWVRPRILTGEEEAELSWAAVAHWHGDDLVTLDVGGGSSELSQGRDFLSLPVGALSLRHEMGVMPGPEYRKWSRETLKGVDFKPFRNRPLVLVGGTAVAMAMLHLDLAEFRVDRIEGLSMTRDDLDRLIQRLCDVSKELRSHLPGLEHGRSEVIICGLYWIRSLLEKMKVDAFRISTLGLRFGVLLNPEEISRLQQNAQARPRIIRVAS